MRWRCCSNGLQRGREVSFEVAIRQLGGGAILLSAAETHLGRGSHGESIADTARVLSRYADAAMIRATAHDSLLAFAEHAAVPVINGLTYRSHPCQVLGDVMTFEERLGPIRGRTIAWCGDGNNVAHSFIQAAGRFGLPPAARVSRGARAGPGHPRHGSRGGCRNRLPRRSRT